GTPVEVPVARLVVGSGAGDPRSIERVELRVLNAGGAQLSARTLTGAEAFKDDLITTLLTPRPEDLNAPPGDEGGRFDATYRVEAQAVGEYRGQPFTTQVARTTVVIPVVAESTPLGRVKQWLRDVSGPVARFAADYHRLGQLALAGAALLGMALWA